jgi:hypothetical protein
LTVVLSASLAGGFAWSTPRADSCCDWSLCYEALSSLPKAVQVLQLAKSRSYYDMHLHLPTHS